MFSLPSSPSSTLFPYTTLFRSVHPGNEAARARRVGHPQDRLREPAGVLAAEQELEGLAGGKKRTAGDRGRTDRKSTRLNSSHRCISYAVFCLKKKKKKKEKHKQ